MCPTDRERIEELQKVGRISAAEAQEIGAAVERIERVRQGASRAGRPAVGKMGLFKARFLRGELDAESLRALYRRAGVRMGALFGILMAVVNGLWFGLDGGDGFHWPMASTQFLGHLLVGGPLFGLVMYRWILRPQAEKLIRLVEATGAPLDPLPALRPGQCPTCGAENAKLWDRHHIAMLHWVINPALAFNELALGQRVPDRIEICRECGTHYVRCEGCDGSVDSSAWQARDLLGRWKSDLACPVCSHPIPCLRNGWAAAAEWIFRAISRPLRA